MFIEICELKKCDGNTNRLFRNFYRKYNRENINNIFSGNVFVVVKH